MADALSGYELQEAVAKRLGWERLCSGCWLAPANTTWYSHGTRYTFLPLDHTTSFSAWLRDCWPVLRKRGYTAYAVYGCEGVTTVSFEYGDETSRAVYGPEVAGMDEPALATAACRAFLAATEGE